MKDKVKRLKQEIEVIHNLIQNLKLTLFTLELALADSEIPIKVKSLKKKRKV